MIPAPPGTTATYQHPDGTHTWATVVAFDSEGHPLVIGAAGDLIPAADHRIGEARYTTTRIDEPDPIVAVTFELDETWIVTAGEHEKAIGWAVTASGDTRPIYRDDGGGMWVGGEDWVAASRRLRPA